MLKINRRIAVGAASVLASLGVAASAMAAMPDSAAITTPGTQASVIAMNQKLDGNKVDITYAYLPKDGTLGIFSSDPGASSGAKPIGKVDLTAGDHRDVAVKLDSSPTAGTKLWAAVMASNAQKPFVAFGAPAEESFKTK